MIYSPSTTAAIGIVEDAQPEEPLTLRGEGLWVCLISSGKCVVSLSDLDLMPAGSALLLPPQNAAAGHLVLSRGPLTLAPENECHLLCVQLTGQAAEQFLAGLSEMPFLARGETCPAAAELMGRLAEERDASERVRSQLAFALLCELSDADSAAPALPPLVAAAIEDIRRNYAGLYGVEELSERLGVSKININTECQLVFAEATRKYIEAGKDQQGKGFDPRKLLAPGAKAIEAKCKEKIELFGCAGKA